MTRLQTILPATFCLTLAALLGCGGAPPGSGESTGYQSQSILLLAPDSAEPEATCSSDASCDDGAGCTLDVCAQGDGFCAHAWIDGCCDSDADCVSADPCFTGGCLADRCHFEAMSSCGMDDSQDHAGGTECGSSSACDDGDACTDDVCVDTRGLCAHVSLSSCEESGTDVTLLDAALAGGDPEGGEVSASVVVGGSGTDVDLTLGDADGGAAVEGPVSTGLGGDGDSGQDSGDPDAVDSAATASVDVGLGGGDLGGTVEATATVGSTDGDGTTDGVEGEVDVIVGGGSDADGTSGGVEGEVDVIVGGGGDDMGSGGESSGGGSMNAGGASGEGEDPGGEDEGASGSEDPSSKGDSGSSHGQGDPDDDPASGDDGDSDDPEASMTGEGNDPSDEGGDEKGNMDGRAPVLLGEPGAASGAGVETDTTGMNGGGRAEFRGGACSVTPLTESGARILWWAFVLAAAAAGARRRQGRGALGAVAAFGSVSLAREAHAQGFAIDSNAVPHAPEDLLWTERPAIPMDHLSFFGRLMLGYADDPLVVRNTTTGAEMALIDAQYALYPSAGLALFDRFHISAAVPIYGHDAAATSATASDPSGLAAGNPRVDARVNVLPVGELVELGLGAGLEIPVGSSSQLAADEEVAGGLRSSIGRSFGDRKQSFVAVNLGVHGRAQRSLGNVMAGSEFRFGVGASWAFIDALAVTGELHGSTSFDDAFADDSTPVGLLFGLRYAPEAWSVAAGVGPGVSGGYGSPDVRVMAEAGARLNRKRALPSPVAAAPAALAVPARDSDGDGIVDARDACRLDPEDHDGFEDGDGCPDRDNDRDGMADASDQCPNDPEDADGFEDADGCSDSDNDADAIADLMDRCPMDPEDKDEFEDDDGCPDRDDDGDQIADAADACPRDPETKNGVEDSDGCPDKVRVVAGHIQTLEPIFFENGSAQIQERSEALLAEIGRVIQGRPELGAIAIEGHTDERGAADYNLRLSEARAQSVRAFLLETGVGPARLSATGYGESRPIRRGHTSADYATNRRVEFRFGTSTKDYVASDAAKGAQ